MKYEEELVIQSDCEDYQYISVVPLEGGDKGACMVLGINPLDRSDSKVDKGFENCKAYAERNGYSSLIFANIFAFRNVDPTELVKVPDPVGPENDMWLLKAASDADIIIGAWGDFPRTKNRVYAVMKLLVNYDFYAIQTNRNGSPSHPLAWKKKAAKLYRKGKPSDDIKVAG